MGDVSLLTLFTRGCIRRGMYDKTYIDITEHEFKTSFRNHKMSLNNKNYSKSTALSKYTRERKKVSKPLPSNDLFKNIHMYAYEWC